MTRPVRSRRPARSDRQRTLTMDRVQTRSPAGSRHLDDGVHTVSLPGGVEVASPVIVRIAGLPAATLADLRSARSFSLARYVVGQLQRLTAEAEALSDDLFLAIGGCPPGTGKAA